MTHRAHKQTTHVDTPRRYRSQLCSTRFKIGRQLLPFCGEPATCIQSISYDIMRHTIHAFSRLSPHRSSSRASSARNLSISAVAAVLVDCSCSFKPSISCLRISHLIHGRSMRTHDQRVLFAKVTWHKAAVQEQGFHSNLQTGPRRNRAPTMVSLV